MNKSPELQQILEAPVNPYTRYSLRRFLQAVGEGFIKMGLVVIAEMVRRGIVDFTKVLLDSFPIYSFLNTAKCLRMPKFDRTVAKLFFHHLSLEPIIKLFPPQHWKAAPLGDKLKVWVHHYLWDVPSVAKNYDLIFGEKNRQGVLGLTKGWKTAQTYRNFLTAVRALPNFSAIETALVTEVSRVLRFLNVLPKKKVLQHMEDLCRVFHNPHRLKDPGITLNYCAAKDQTFMGRGGLIAGLTSFELPLFLQVTPKYKLNERGIMAFLTDLQSYFGQLLRDAELYADAEFGTVTIKTMIETILQATAIVESYGNSLLKSSMDQKTVRKTIERIIARLETNFQLEHPRFLGPEFVAIHTQLCSLCDLFLVSYNIFSGNQAHSHAIQQIRG